MESDTTVQVDGAGGAWQEARDGLELEGGDVVRITVTATRPLALQEGWKKTYWIMRSWNTQSTTEWEKRRWSDMPLGVGSRSTEALRGVWSKGLHAIELCCGWVDAVLKYISEEIGGVP